MTHRRTTLPCSLPPGTAAPVTSSKCPPRIQILFPILAWDGLRRIRLSQRSAGLTSARTQSPERVWTARTHPAVCQSNPGVREVGWIDSGGGYSILFPRPAFQNTLPPGSTFVGSSVGAPGPNFNMRVFQTSLSRRAREPVRWFMTAVRAAGSSSVVRVQCAPVGRLDCHRGSDRGSRSRLHQSGSIPTCGRPQLLYLLFRRDHRQQSGESVHPRLQRLYGMGRRHGLGYP